MGHDRGEGATTAALGVSGAAGAAGAATLARAGAAGVSFSCVIARGTASPSTARRTTPPPTNVALRIDAMTGPSRGARGPDHQVTVFEVLKRLLPQAMPSQLKISWVHLSHAMTHTFA